MKNKFSKNDLLKMIDSELVNLSEDKIKELINKELSKDNSKIDMDYIDLCYDLLELKSKNNKNSNGEKPKVKSAKRIKFLISAAVIMLFVVSTLTVSAQVFNFNIPQKIAQLINGNAEIDLNLELADTIADDYALLDSDLAQNVATYGISPITFPEEMINENCIITNVELLSVETDVSIDVNIEFEYKGIYGNMTIEQYKQDFEFTGEQTSLDTSSGQVININGMDVLVFEHKENCSIIYKDNTTEYSIYLESDLDTAINFVESIK